MARHPRLLRRVLTAAFVITAVSQSTADDSVRIEKGRIDITLKAPGELHTLPATIRVSLLLRNPTDSRDTTRRVFPIAAPPRMRLPQQRSPWCRLTVDGLAVEFETKPLVDSAERIPAWPDPQQAIVWSSRLDEWFAKDPPLLSLIERYRKLAADRQEMSELTETFQRRVKRHLIHKDLDYAALQVAIGGPYFGYLIRLMPEIEPACRIDGKFQRWEYVSLLSDSDPDQYRPYEKEWREKADRWFASKPDLVLLVPKLRGLWESFREAQKLIAGPILKHLHDVRGLSLPVAVQMKSFIEGGSKVPPTALLRKLFPDYDAELEKQSLKISKQLRDHGFDESTVSPFTGRLIGGWSISRPFERTFRNDETVRAALGRPTRSRPAGPGNGEAIIAPVLISFDAPLEPKSSATVILEYDTQLLPLQHPLSSTIAFGPEEIMAVFPSPRDVPYSVTCPASCQPVIAPGPRAVALLDKEVRRFDGRLNADESVLHIAAVSFAHDPLSWTYRFPESDPGIRSDLEMLVDKVDNITVRPLLMTAQYTTMLREGDRWEAHELSVDIREEHPDFSRLLESIQTRNHSAREARSLYGWVQQKSKSPQIETEDDFKRFERRSGYHSYQLTPAALQALARGVAELKSESLTLQEQMGRLFILCEANVEREKNLAALLKLAESNPAEAHASLKLIQHLTVEKSAALPFVISQIDLSLRDKARAGKVKTDSFEWIRQNHAYYAMGTFRSPKTAKRIIQFIQSTEDSLLVQGAIQALSHMTLPGLFDELTEIADRIAASSASGYIMYLDLMLRSDRDRGIRFLSTLPQRHPKLSRYVLQALGNTGMEMALPQALELYRNSSDVRGELATAVTVIRKLAEPKDIAALEYRQGLPEWMNGHLVSVIRTKGGDRSVFPFVEAYYLEFVKGQKKHNHLTCVRAFERTGDRRAIPYLREILHSTERKRDAAEALGHLLFDRRIIQQPFDDPEMDRHIRAISDDKTSEEQRTAAWKALLSTPEKSFDRVMVRSAVRNALEDAHSDWTETTADRCRFIAGFGDIAAARLLEKSDGCSLHERYRIARLLTLLLPRSQELLNQAAADLAADKERRRTAQLALKLGSNLTAE